MGIDIAQFSGDNCEAGTLITPVIKFRSDDCGKLDTAPGKSLTVSTVPGDVFFCRSDQHIMLKVWKNSDACAGEPDSTIGPLSSAPSPGSCVGGQIRSAKLSCVGGGATPLKARTIPMPFEG